MEIISNKIFQIGFSKCGTSSLYTLFSNNGIPSIHWDNGNLAKKVNENIINNKKPLDGYDDCIFFSDMLFISYDEHIEIYKKYKLLDIYYPNSKFILNVRDVNKWLKSTKKHPKLIERLCSIYKMSDDEMIRSLEKQWSKHISDIKKYFINRENDLLIFDIENDNPIEIKNFIKNYNIDISFYKIINKTVW